MHIISINAIAARSTAFGAGQRIERLPESGYSVEDYNRFHKEITSIAMGVPLGGWQRLSSLPTGT